MSTYDGSLSTQPDWQGHDSFLPPGEGGSFFGQPYEQVSSSSNNNDAASRPRSSSTQIINLDAHGQTSSSTLSSPISHHRVLDPLGLRQSKPESATQEQPGMTGPTYRPKSETIHEDTLSSSQATQHALEANRPVSAPPAEQNRRISSSVCGNEETLIGKDDDDEVLDDEDMEEGDGEGEGDGEDGTPNRPQTAAERTAARRKMKRFR